MLKQKKIENVAIYITRVKGDENIGPKRFQIIRDIVDELFQILTSVQCNPIDSERGSSQWSDEEGEEEFVDETSTSRAGFPVAPATLHTTDEETQLKQVSQTEEEDMSMENTENTEHIANM